MSVKASTKSIAALFSQTPKAAVASDRHGPTIATKKAPARSQPGLSALIRRINVRTFGLNQASLVESGNGLIGFALPVARKAFWLPC